MSRAPPFPATSRRAKSPGPRTTSPPPTAPLAINRAPSRPQTPANNRSGIPPSPARPARSGLRSRVTSTTSNGSVPSYLDGSRTAVDGSFSRPIGRDRLVSATDASRVSSYSTTSNGRIPERNDNISPTQIEALSAFKLAGTRRATRDDERDNYRQREVEQEQERQRKMRERSRARRVNGRAKAGDIDAILEDVKYDWPPVMDPDFNPVDLALNLLDEKSQGRDMEAFQNTRITLQKALKGTIDQNYQAFAAALPHHSSLVNTLGTTQEQIGSIRQSLTESKEAVANKRADLVQLWQRGQQVEEMMKILDKIESLKTIPDTLETLMSEKRLLAAAALLVHSLKIINKPDMLEIGALSDLRSYLVSQENSLRDILVEELHAHIYLKSFWCDSRWAPYIPDQQIFMNVPFDEDAKLADRQDRPQHSRLFRYLQDLALKPNESPIDSAGPSTSQMASLPSSSSLTSIMEAETPPESDSFSYMENVLESLTLLGKLSATLELVSQRIPNETFNLVESTITEVSERLESANRMSMLPLSDDRSRPSSLFFSSGTTAAGGLRLAALEHSVKENSREVLRDLFWTLYSKLDAVVQGLRVVSEVANRIASRRNFKDDSDIKVSTLFPLTDQWLPVQAEIRGLLHDYLVDEQSGAAASNRNPISSISEVLRQSSLRPGVPIKATEQGKVFRLADSEAKTTTKALRSYEDSLTRALHDTVPGLANQSGEANVQAALSSIGTDDRMISAGQHTILLSPDTFHVGVLFQPTLVFLDRMVEILPAGIESARATSAYLDEFVLNSYLPQLQDKVAHLFHLAVSGPEAFREDVTYRRLYGKPLIKSTVQIMALVNTLCVMHQTTPFHKEDHARLILGIVMQFYQQCSDASRDLVARESLLMGKPPMVLAAQWIQNSDISNCLTAQWQNTNDKSTSDLQEQETRIELGLVGNSLVVNDDVLPTTRDLMALSILRSSLTWFIQQLRLLRPPSDDPTTPLGLPEPSTSMTPFTPNLPIVTTLKPNDPLQLPLSSEMAARFTSLLKAFQQLADDILYTIRLDIRCRTIRLLNMMRRKSNYILDREAGEPDGYIIELNKELAGCDDATNQSLGDLERSFVLGGLGLLMSHLLISQAIDIQGVNENGVKKMQRNILALQQNLKTIHHGPKETELDKAKRYWAAYFQDPQHLLTSFRQKRLYSLEEYEAMLGFICGVAPGKDPEDPSFETYLVELRQMSNEQ